MEFSFDAPALDRADRNIDQEIIYIENQEAPTFRILHRVMLRWHQTNRDEAKTAGPKSSDKAIIDDVSEKHLGVFLSSGRRNTKRRMTGIEENPSRKGFVVDVHVQYLNGQAKSYTILELHSVSDIDDGIGEA